MTRGGAGRAETPSARTGRDADHHDGAGRNAVLAIEVSQRHGGVAAVRLGNGAPVGAAAPRLGNGASIGAAAPGPEIVGIAVGPPNPDRDRLMPAIDEAMRAISAVPRELAAVVVSIGPGGFTGLRMAVAATKAISLATGCGIVAVRSAVVAARSAAMSVGSREATSIVALAGKGADAWISLVDAPPRDDAPCRIRSESLLDAQGFERLVAALPATEPRTLVADEFLPRPLAEVAVRLGLVRRELSPSARACLLEGLALRAADDAGAIVAADDLLPLYPREPEAVRLWRERGKNRATA